MNVVIVGADSRKFTEEQLRIAKREIASLLINYQANWIDTTIISGGCPVGKKRWYDISCDEWRDVDDVDDHLTVEAYDQGGIDTLAKIVATELWMKFIEISPEVNQWNDAPNCAKGFKSRNLEMVKMADILYCISPKCYNCDEWGRTGTDYDADNMEWSIICTKCKGTKSVWNGGMWTSFEAERQGKKVVRIVVP